MDLLVSSVKLTTAPSAQPTTPAQSAPAVSSFKALAHPLSVSNVISTTVTYAPVTMSAPLVVMTTLLSLLEPPPLASFARILALHASAMAHARLVLSLTVRSLSPPVETLASSAMLPTVAPAHPPTLPAALLVPLTTEFQEDPV